MARALVTVGLLDLNVLTSPCPRTPASAFPSVLRLRFDRTRAQGLGAAILYVCTDALASSNRIGINILAVGARLPTIHGSRDYIEAGGLISFGPDYPDLFRRAADYVDKILRGSKPANIPVEQPTKFNLVINLNTAKALGLTIPPTLLATADEVIE